MFVGSGAFSWLFGRVGRDPETKNNACSFPIGVNQGYTDKDGNWVKKDPCWFRVVTFQSQLADIIDRKIKKGMLVSCACKIDQYKDRDGNVKDSHVITDFTILSESGSGGRRADRDRSDYDDRQSRGRPEKAWDNRDDDRGRERDDRKRNNDPGDDGIPF